jgi:F-type H+-transporting ATPase subunit epsilon
VSERLNIDITTPEGITSNFVATMVVVPGEEGELGILPRHVPMIVGTKYGFVKFFDGMKLQKQVFIADSFVEITDEAVVILTDRSIDLEKASQLDINSKISEIEEKLSRSKSASLESELKFFRALKEQVSEVN